MNVDYIITILYLFKIVKKMCNFLKILHYFCSFLR